jgi:hypothetical protein
MSVANDAQFYCALAGLGTFIVLEIAIGIFLLWHYDDTLHPERGLS